MIDEESADFILSAERLISIIQCGEAEWAVIAIKTVDGGTIKLASKAAPRSLRLP